MVITRFLQMIFIVSSFLFSECIDNVHMNIKKIGTHKNINAQPGRLRRAKTGSNAKHNIELQRNIKTQRRMRAKSAKPSYSPSAAPTNTPTESPTASRRTKSAKPSYPPSTVPTKSSNTLSPSSSPITSPTTPPSEYPRWKVNNKIAALDGATGDSFGSVVAVSGNIAIVGANNDGDKGPNSGSAYVYEKDDSSGNWTEVAKLTASGGTENDFFGRAVAISGNRAIVGALGNYACVYEMDKSSRNWTEVVKLRASDKAVGTSFGFADSVSISGNIAIVGAFMDHDNGPQTGSAYVYEIEKSSGNWTEVDKLTASDGVMMEHFGNSVSVSGNIAIVGAYRD